LIGLILAAGPTCCCDTIGFPPNSKPKCLFHYYKDDSDETLLERQVRLLRKKGISRIRIVTGYRHQDIEQFNRDKSLGLELIYNPKWEIDGVNSLIVGIQGIEDDLLIVMSDLFIKEKDLDNILRYEKPTTSTVRHGYLCKFGKQHLPLLKRADEFRRGDQDLRDLMRVCAIWHQESKVKCPHDNTQGLKLGRTITYIFKIAKEKGEAVYIEDHATFDVDYFRQTAEAVNNIKL